MAVSDHYRYRVVWSAEDEEHVGLCTELPSLSWLASTPDEALAGIRELISGCEEDMRASGEEPPRSLGDTGS
ncbi:MAG: hypothetical protein J4F98_13800 [Acidobacteria bacterium]|nr:hypothetical protein [Acidobacteriota bacterium]